MTSTSKPVRLTELTNLAGCTAKASADEVERVLEQLRSAMPRAAMVADADLMVGLDQPDDAAVYRLSDDRALIMTVDFFAPVVDDPYCYGAIAAANAMSDVYAMGGEVAMALNIAGFPLDMDEDVVAEIYRGGAEKVAEAGGVIVGGHTIIDAEPKYGLSVIGFADPKQILTKGGAEAGDALYLTKPLGTGLIATAAKFEEAEEEHLHAAVVTMAQLNREPARIVREVGVHALTDVTGFGILGHGYEVAKASGVALEFAASALPILPGAMEYAYRGILTGGEFRNRQHLEGHVRIADAVSEDCQHLLYDPQTSGGLLIAVAAERTDALEEGFAAADVALWRVGEVVEGTGVTVRV